MRIRVIAVGTRMPAWVDQVFTDYTRRLGTALPVALTEIPATPRSPGRDSARAAELEGRRMLQEVRADDFCVLLDEHGKELSTRELANWLAGRMRDGRDVSFLVGGPDGLGTEVRARGDFSLALSRLTLPHAFARVLLAEQIYRAHTVLAGHPYHRD
jgi:23S rRNA (pseudouridine1915-N3)-methyltransferase